MSKVRAWGAHKAKDKFVPFEYEAGELGDEEVEIAVEYCGLCHSDLSILNNDWGYSVYPLVAGHEIIGRVVALGRDAKGLSIGQRVGVGWNAESCLHCRQCLSGNQNMCPEVKATIVGHYGGFAERVRAQWDWVIPIPEALDKSAAGPLLCGGITVFTPFYVFDVQPTQRVGIVGIGGLGHMAVKFAEAWGCDVTAFSSSPAKFEEAKSFGANHVVSSRDSDAIRAMANSLDLILVTVNVGLDWQAFIGALAPRGRLHFVGAVAEPVPVAVPALINAQKSISASPSGSPVATIDMLDFAARHHILPQVEHYKMSQINEAFDRLKSGKAQYRIVLEADFA
ncbi:NADPH-dependent aldehyde reductase Ahr [Tengunoibacter tsumagoiensis]|uniref:alcohol dehydrogenase (NADP(+)) n=1 Tax=Tengunoibacter tsumagoiensis TaxID=2014871 RepID=A0A402A1E2_9CHLR|nr:NAD(P)-dependent alcohol dehydrogenase [Tengunoibacter tsumagoiensis]GCE12831.1 alcohol dehydrogenase [Tengunoibacter tsumagoiensis]